MNIHQLYKIASGLMIEQQQSGDRDGELRAEGIAYLFNFIVRELEYAEEVRRDSQQRAQPFSQEGSGPQDGQ